MFPTASRIACLTAGITAMTVASATFAQTRSQVTGSALTKRTHTAFIRGDVGLQTYESQLVDSNATTTAVNYAAGGYAGEERLMGVFVNGNRSKTAFALNDSAIATSLNELHVQARLGFLYASLIGSLTDIRVTHGASAATPTTNRMTGSGYGAGLSLHVPLTSNMTVNAGAKSVVTPNTETYEPNAKAKIGARTEADASMSFDVFDNVIGLMVGYRYRTFAVSLNDVDAKEKQSAPYAGLELGVYF